MSILSENPLCHLSNVFKYSTHKREPFYELLRHFLNQEDIILDVGSGNNTFSKHFSEYNIRGLDKNKTGTDKWTAPENINVMAESVNVIHCSMLVEHLYPHELYKLLTEFDRILKHGGIICISTPILWKNFYSDMSHIRPYNPSVFINYLSSMNLKNRTGSIIGDYELLSLTYRYQPRILPIFKKSGYTIIFKKRILNGVICVKCGEVESIRTAHGGYKRPVCDKCFNKSEDVDEVKL